MPEDEDLMSSYPSLSLMDDDIAGFDQIITGDQVVSLLVSGATGAGGILLASSVLPRIDFLSDKPMVKALITMGVGFVGGAALWRLSRDAAVGLSGGMMGFGLASLIGNFAGVNVTLGDSRLLSGTLSDRELLPGRRRRALRQPIVREPEQEFRDGRAARGSKRLNQPDVDEPQPQFTRGTMTTVSRVGSFLS